MGWNPAELQWGSLLHLTLEITLIAGLILLLFRLRTRYGLGLLYVFIGSNQYLQSVLASALYLDLGGGVTVSLGSVVIFSSTLFAILLTYLQEDIPKTRVLIYGVIFSNLTLTALAWLTNHQIRSLPTRNLLSVPQELFSINSRAFLVGTIALILDAFLIVIVYEILLAKAKRMPLAVRLITTLLLVLYFDALVFTLGAFFGTERFGAVLVNQLIGKTLAGVLYGLILYSYIKLSGAGSRGDQVIQSGAETGVLSILTYRERYQIVKQQLESSEAANVAKNRFLAHMSHELRTPLNAVIGFTNVLRKNKAGNLNAKDTLYLERIFGNAKHLLDLINGILDLSKIESGRSELVIDRFELNSLIEETVDEMRGQALERNLELETELIDGPVSCETDRSALKRVLINLIGNALKFTDEGRVTVRLVAGTRSARAVEVIDTGIGIEPSDLESIFEAFKQAGSPFERRQGGTGLGLAISRALCELMGYGLEVESELGRGSVFRVVME